MKTLSGLRIRQNRNTNKIWSNYKGKWREITDLKLQDTLYDILKIYRKRVLSSIEKENLAKSILEKYENVEPTITVKPITNGTIDAAMKFINDAYTPIINSSDFTIRVDDGTSYKISESTSITPEIIEKSIKDSIKDFDSLTSSDDERINKLKAQIEEVKKNKEIEKQKELDKTEITNGINKLINFFSEFSFEPNFRFVNTFCLKLQKSRFAAKEYISNYFDLSDNSYKSSIDDKMNSAEFDMICSNLSKVKPNKKINNRFELFYGSQGTGKTTYAMEQSNNNVMVCHSAMLPSDLMEDFKFIDGKPNFKPSALQNAMINGEKIVLDEINLLPFESLRFLQSILDGKKQFIYKGNTLEIKDGFKIIGTMNLSVNGTIYALPEPLVDRCENIKKYKLTAEQLLGAIL